MRDRQPRRCAGRHRHECSAPMRPVRCRSQSFSRAGQAAPVRSPSTRRAVSAPYRRLVAEALHAAALW